MARRSRQSLADSQEQESPPLEVLPLARGTFGKTLVNWLFPAYVLLIAVGFLIFKSGHATPVTNPQGVDRALFHSINAATMTGLQYSIDVRVFTPLGRWTAMLLIAAGTLFSLIVGGLAMVRILRLPYSDRRVVNASFLLLAIVAVVGTVGGMISGRGWFESLFLAVSAFGNSGAVLDQPPELREPLTNLLLLPLAVLGGMGVTVLLELFDVIRRRGSLSTHARVVFVGLAIAYVASLGLMMILRWPDDGALLSPHNAGWLASCSTAAINSRSLGMPFLQDDAAALPRAAQWGLMVIMLIGAASGGTGGGLKVTTLAEFYQGTKRLLRGESPGRPMGIAIVWVAIFFALIVLFQLMLTTGVGEVPGDRLLFFAISALTNTGLAHESLSITGGGLFTLSAAMFAGRVVPLLILWWMADSTTDAEIAVG
jgi:trk system potassium uptake protein TrkH